LFSGAGALCELAVAPLLGGEVVWHCEFEPPSKKNPSPRQAAARVLAHRFPNTPNLGDITAMDWATVEPVDVVTLGFPCTDVSSAGQRAGIRPDTRSGLWNHGAYAISVLRPRLVVIENVRGLSSAPAHSDVEPCPWCLGDGPNQHALRALGAVLGDLAELGYDAVWCGLRAADVGACHGRFRFVILAAPADASGPGWQLGESFDVGEHRGEEDGGRQAEPGRRDRVTAAAAEPLLPTPRATDGAKGGPNQRGSKGGNWSLEGAGADLAAELAVDWGIYEPAIRRHERWLGRPVPFPTITGARGGKKLNPQLSEWMMGWPAGWVTDVPGLTPNDALQVCGNGVVPQQMAAAVKYLLLILHGALGVAA
jgi:DNA (cytosine-5)-methyltransferase 1